MTDVWKIIEGMIPGLIAAIPVLTALIVATVKIIRAVKDNRSINNKLDGLIDLIALDYQSRKSVTPLEKQAMMELAQKVRGGGKIDGAMVAAETKKLVEKLANTVDNMVSKPTVTSVTSVTPITHVDIEMPDGFIDSNILA